MMFADAAKSNESMSDAAIVEFLLDVVEFAFRLMSALESWGKSNIISLSSLGEMVADAEGMETPKVEDAANEVRPDVVGRTENNGDCVLFL